MVRLVGVDLPRNKKIAYALTYIHVLQRQTKSLKQPPLIRMYECMI